MVFLLAVFVSSLLEVESQPAIDLEDIRDLLVAIWEARQ